MGILERFFGKPPDNLGMDAAALKKRGNLYLSKGDRRRAVQDYTDALKLDPKYADAFYNRARAYLGAEEFGLALADCDEVIKLKPDADTYANRGFARLGLREDVKALDDFNEALRLNPDHKQALSGRAQAYTVLGKDADADEDFRRAVQLGIEAGSLKKAMEGLRELRR